MKKIMQIICLLVFLYMNRINSFFFLKDKRLSHIIIYK